MREFDAGPFARKLRAAMSESGCRSLAEFIARVRSAAPDSSVTLDRAYKWLQGRAAPNDPRVYDDLATALGLPAGGAFVRDSTVEAFVDRLRQGGAAPAGAGATAGTTVDRVVPSGLRDGAYAAYSLARDVAAGGSVVRGCLRVATDPASGIRRIDYAERDGAVRLSFSGDLVASRRLHTVTLAPEQRDESLSLALAVPGQPVPVVGGLMIGQAQYAVAARPVCTRILMLAVRNTAVDPEAGSGDYGTGSGRIAADVAAIGYGNADCAALAAQILAHLTSPSDGRLDVSHQSIEAISLMLALATRLPGAA